MWFAPDTALYYGQPFINITLFMLQQTLAVPVYDGFAEQQTLCRARRAAWADIVPTTGQPLSQFRYGIDPLPVSFPGFNTV